MKLKDLYRQAKPTGGATSNGWHQIQDFLICAMKYKLGQVCGLRQPVLQTSDPLAKGQLFHEGRAWWYDHKFATNAKAWAQLQEHVKMVAHATNPPIAQRAITETLSYLEQYIAHWSILPLPTPIGAEYSLGPAPLKKDDPWWLYRTARLDDVSYYPEARGKLCIGECKTTSVGIDDCENEYTLHGQLLMQFMLWRMSDNGEKKHGPISHVLLDVVKKGYGGDKCTFARVPVQVTHTALAWYVPSMQHYLTQAARVSETTPVPRNPSACTRQIGRMRVPCEFRDLCKFGSPAASKYVNRDGISASTLYADREVKPWD